jgi:hypothetical protein
MSSYLNLKPVKFYIINSYQNEKNIDLCIFAFAISCR